MSVTVRYKPRYDGDQYPYMVIREGGRPTRWRHFRTARRHTKHLNFGELPEVGSFDYDRMFPDRIAVWRADSGRWRIERGGNRLDDNGYKTHEEAMTAATQLAKETA